MKRGLSLTYTLLFSLVAFPTESDAASRPPLGTAVDFAVLGSSTVTNTGPTVVNGDLGVSPGTSVTGFYPAGIVNGTIYTGVGSNAGPAQADALVAYNDAAGQACDTELTGTDLGGLTLLPGVYCFDFEAEITGTLTLDFQGDSNAVFIFQMGSTLITASNAIVVTINGVPSCNNVIWQVGSSATLGTGTDFFGDILASESITMTNGASIDGSLYALNGAVTLDSNVVSACGPSCASDAECVDDGNVCTTELCTPGHPLADAAGCIVENNVLACDDSAYCTTGDACSAGVCAGLVPRDCADSNLCTDDSCNEGTDACLHADNVLPCDDLLFCTVGDTCGGGLCEGTPRECADGTLCTTDTCNDATDVCEHANNTLACDDLQFCTSGDACSAGTCIGGPATDCSDTNVCTDDSCSEAGNVCVHLPNTMACDDLQFCTLGDACSAGDCLGTPRACTDMNLCTDDSCDEVNDTCTTVDNTAPCEDDLFCTVGDACEAGSCSGGLSRDCTDMLSCTTDTCLEATDECGHESNTCGDGIVDTSCGELCDAPDEEICNSGVDEDGDGDIDCADGDCLEPNPPGCSGQCQFLDPCVPLLRDPAIIYVGAMDRRAARNGNFSFHGRMVPNSSANPVLDSFAVMLSNDEGTIYRGELPAGALNAKRKGRFSYKADLEAEEEGIRSLRIKRRKDAGLSGYSFRVRVQGDFSSATLALMTTQVYLGDDVAYVTAKWRFRDDRWILAPADY